MVNSGIYKIENKANGKFYVGSAINLNRRFYDHRNKLNNNTHHNRTLQNSWNKHGESTFSFSVLEYVEDISVLVKREQYWIDELQVVVMGYNVCTKAGSHLGLKRSAQTKKRMSIAQKGKVKTPEHRLNIGKAQKGRKQSSEHIAKAAAARRGHRLSDEAKLKISKANRGRKRSDEFKRLISSIKTGVKRKPFTPETLKKMSTASSANMKKVWKKEFFRQNSESLGVAL